MFWNSFKRILTANPMGLFVYGILSKWYLTILISSVVVTFWVFKGLEKAGVLDTINTVMFKALDDTKIVAQYCVPKIANLSDFWNCLSNPPTSRTIEPDERNLEEQLEPMMQNNVPANNHNTDPYE